MADQPQHLPLDTDAQETQEWMEGFEAQREAWEAQYAEAQARWEAHRAQVAASAVEDAEQEEEAAAVAAPAAEDLGGTLASDEALAALRDKLTGSN